METHLDTCNVVWFVQQEITAEEEASVKRQGSMALSQIHQAIDVSIFGKIANAKTAKQAWDILLKKYKGVHRVQKNNLLMLTRKFDLITMEKSEPIESYFS